MDGNVSDIWLLVAAIGLVVILIVAVILRRKISLCVRYLGAIFNLTIDKPEQPPGTKANREQGKKVQGGHEVGDVKDVRVNVGPSENSSVKINVGQNIDS